ncbi:MAG: 4-(cytidine 5'-diphospho)-2-C-methyl-D-erythritol kinase [Actinobacteria bacterium]|nr:4-(cytidine 5'-diphospho)-2-C-methyl-D-erythritol kinase [Cyanobacteriota bacterium]MCL5771886.1 4-(cytidine 5'-diphospho)-2-C-methyl-D-erythritol kinase [Actinomycetota bacterium]
MLISEIAPAKINLTLEIIGERHDGYHEISSLMQTIDLCDYLTFHKNPWLQIIPEYHNLPVGDNLPGFDRNNYLVKNLVYKTAEALKNKTGYNAGAVIELKKNIPSSAGLGGGSSDAAATLRGLNKLWNLKLSPDELAEIGAEVGSDVPFFVYGGTCIVSGRGEIVKPIKPLKHKWLLLILLPYNIKDKTKKLYSYVNEKNFTNGSFTKRLAESINDNNEETLINSCLFNSFETVFAQLYEDYKKWLKDFEDIGVSPIHLAGSGPSIYYISNNESEILGAAGKISSITNLSIYITRTVP